ncbi:Heparinase II/III-like protein [Paenibacillus sp. UNCCL117]|uniref:heparin/heparin-sulfate lyase HepB n=1 Tax=unclassified Paenibacillus TaxID=185978 RepID=UPI000891F006|nr:MULTISPECIES: heparin/heparin-sulfate lyase HepB [unclassified Paenibacillus]SDD41827.1 Heparinase II/III-like protein [Paenibacillus sp. cl123]SFW47752.1 Heparinase II/III-like protein [Paenibacillus sp. UNCCL117]
MWSSLKSWTSKGLVASMLCGLMPAPYAAALVAGETAADQAAASSGKEAAAQAAGLADISGHWAEPAIRSWLSQGRIAGYPDGTFRPDRTITRAEFASLAAALFPAVAEPGLRFQDVQQGAWQETAVAEAVGSGLMDGYAEGVFRPDAPISRQEAAAALGRVLGLQERAQSVGFSDETDWPAWSRAYIVAAHKAGIMEGYEDGAFRPEGRLTRGEALMLLTRAERKQAEPLTLAQAGEYGPGEGAWIVHRDVAVAAPGVTLRHMTIAGKLDLTEGIGEGEALLQGVHALGAASVAGGGIHSIYWQNSSAGSLIVGKKAGPVRIVAQGESRIGEVVLNSPAILEHEESEEAGSGVTAAEAGAGNRNSSSSGKPMGVPSGTGYGFHTVLLSAKLPPGADIQLKGRFASVSVLSKESVLSIQSGTIGTLIIDKAAEKPVVRLGKAAVLEMLRADGALEITGEGKIVSAELNASGTSLSVKPEKLELASGVTARIEGILTGESAAGGGSSQSSEEEDDKPEPPPAENKPPTPPSSHPRLFVSSRQDIDKLRAKTQTQLMSPAWKAVLEASGRTTGKEDVIKAKALRYLLGDGESYGEEAADLFDAYVKGFSDTSARGIGSMLLTGAIVYDWCYPLLTAERKADWNARFEQHAAKMEIGYPPNAQGAISGHGAEDQVLRDQLSWAVAVYDERPEIYDTVAGTIFDRYVPVRNWFYRSGMHHRGESYGPYTFAADVASSLIFKALGRDRVYDISQQDVLYHYLYARRPDGSLLRNGDSYEDDQHPYGEYWRNSWSWIGAASYFQDPYLQREFLRNYAGYDGTKANEAGKLDPVLELIYADPELEAKSVADLPLTRYFGSPHGAMIARTGWTEGVHPTAADVVADFRVNEYYFGGHQHLDAGAFQIYYRGALAIDSGNYALYESPHHMNYSRRTIAHNSMLVYDPNEKWQWHEVEPGKYKDPFDGGKLKPIGNDGGQRWPNEAYEPYDLEEITDPAKGYKRGEVLGQQFGPDPVRPNYSYVKGDLTGHYSSKVSDYQRSFMFLNLKGQEHPAAVLVYDRVTAADPTFRKTWLLHSIQEPVVNGSQTTIVRDTDGYDGKLINTTLLPHNAKIVPVGGQGQEFADLDGVNWPETRNTTSSSETGAWRVEISPEAPAATDTFLNVMQVMDGGTEPLAVERIEAGSMEGAKLADRVVLFSKSGERLSGKLELDAPGAGTLQYVIADLKEGLWRIEGGAAASDGVVTKEGGVLAFSGHAGKYTLTYAGEQPVPGKDITEFHVEGQSAEPVIDTQAATVRFRMPYGSDMTKLRPVIRVSEGASLLPVSETACDFTQPAAYTVQDSRGGLRVWTLTGIVDPPSAAKAITAFTIAGQTAPAVIDSASRTVKIRMPYGADITALTPVISVSPYASVSPVSGAVQSFAAGPVDYTVTAQDGSDAVWMVTVSLDAAGDGKDITAFSIPGQSGAASIDAAAASITVPMQEGVDITALRPVITVSAGATVSPLSGEPRDFTAPVTYTVTAQNNSVKTWTVSVKQVKSWFSTIDWVAQSLGSNNTGTVVAEFDLTPLKPLSASGVNSLLAYGDSSTVLDNYPQVPVSIYFNPDNGIFMARDGGAWAAEKPEVPIVVGRKYHFKLQVDLPVRIYSVWVTPEGQAEQLIGRNLAFRTGATAMDDLGKVYLKSLVEDNSFKVENHMISRASDFPGALPTNPVFADEDADMGEVSGTLSWTPASPETGITHYTVYFLNGAGGRVGASLGEVPAGSGKLMIPADTPLPAGAVQLGIYSKNERGESMDAARIAINDDSTIDNRLKIATAMDGLRVMSRIALLADHRIELGFNAKVAAAPASAFKLQRYNGTSWSDVSSFSASAISDDGTKVVLTAASALPTTDAGSYRIVFLKPEEVTNEKGKPLDKNAGDNDSIWFDQAPPKVVEARAKTAGAGGQAAANTLEVVFSEPIQAFDASDLVVKDASGAVWDRSHWIVERSQPNMLELLMKPEASGSERFAVSFPNPVHTADGFGVKLQPTGELPEVTIALEAAPADAPAIKAVWAANESERIKRDDTSNPNRAGNSAWDGAGIKLFGGRNEVLAFQLIVESGAKGIDGLSVSLPSLQQQGGSGVIAYKAPSPDPTEYAGRPIQLFSQHYMNVTKMTNATWILPGTGVGKLQQPTGWFPDQLVPENAKPGKGGFPLTVRPNSNQGIWIEIYTDKALPAGIYTGSVHVVADGETRAIPVELELMDFTLPDENSMDAMLYFESVQTEQYEGAAKDEAYHRLAHRNRVEFVQAYDPAQVEANIGRFDGQAFTGASGYEGPGEGVGNRVIPRTFYSPGTLFDERDSAWSASDEWMTYLDGTFGEGTKRTFVYMPDEPEESQHPYIKQVAANIKSNPGPGGKLPTLITKAYTPDLDAAIDYWTVGTQLYDHDRALIERQQGDDMFVYNGNRPYAGSLVYEAPASDPRANAWGAFEKDIPLYFYWHINHWKHNSSVWRGISREQNVWLEPLTFNNRGGMFGNGDGVLVYPGRDILHPSEDRGIDGPISSMRLVNLRRGLQDHLYMTMLTKRGKTAEVRRIVSGVVPNMYPGKRLGQTLGFAESGSAYEAARYELAQMLEGTPDTTLPTITVTGLVYGMTVAAPVLVFQAYAQDAQEAALTPVVRLDGDVVASVYGDHRYEVTLTEGVHTITVDAEDAQKRKAHTQVFKVTYSSGPAEDEEDQVSAVLDGAGLIRAAIVQAGSADFPSAAWFRVFDGSTALSAFTPLGEAAELSASKAAGDQVVIRIYDGNEVELGMRIVTLSAAD